jgi:hypothetical protein
MREARVHSGTATAKAVVKSIGIDYLRIGYYNTKDAVKGIGITGYYIV